MVRHWQRSKAIHRQTVERVLSLDFLTQRENVIVVAQNGLGKTMIAKNLVYQAILAGHSARFLTAAAALVPGPVTIDGTPRMRERPIGALAAALSSLSR